MCTTSPSLLQRLRQANNQDAWRQFFQIYHPILTRLAERVVRHYGLAGQDADELVSDVSLDLLRRLPTFEYNPQQQFRGLLRTIFHNRACDLLRRRRLLPATGQAPSLLEAGTCEVPLFEVEEYQEYLKGLVGRALEVIRGDFQPRTWQAFLEYTMRRQPAAEVAGRLGCSVEVVYTAQCRVLRRLREELRGLTDE
jgi:RNA polymerase sigma-70 factor (ECF subfamily)